MATNKKGEKKRTLLETLTSHFNDVVEGDRTPSEIAGTLNEWARESADIIKGRVNEEADARVARMGYIKQEQFDELVARVEALESQLEKKSPSRVTSIRKRVTKKAGKNE